MQHRNATEEDAPLLARINQKLIEDEWGGGGMSLPRLEERMRRWITEGEYRAIVFEEGGETVAYALVSVDDDSAYIRHFYVLQEHRGRGAGTAALNTLLGEIVPANVRITLDVLASNAAGHQFWQSVGFRDYSVRMERLPAAGEPKA